MLRVPPIVFTVLAALVVSVSVWSSSRPESDLAFALALILIVVTMSTWLLWVRALYLSSARHADFEPTVDLLPVICVVICSSAIQAVLGRLGGPSAVWFIRLADSVLSIVSLGGLLVIYAVAARAWTMAGGSKSGRTTALAMLGLFVFPVGVWFIRPPAAKQN